MKNMGLPISAEPAPTISAADDEEGGCGPRT
jgi:hypothetical protein